MAIKFKYLGDVAIAIPALHALRQQFPEAELHVLVAQEAVPILEFLPWIDKVWGLPRKRGKWSFKKTWPILSALRKEKFDKSVDFIGNDRGAILSFLVGAKKRLGPIVPKGFWGRKYCYHDRIEEADTTRHEILRDWYVLSKWNIPFPSDPYFKILPNPKLLKETEGIIPSNALLFHLSTSQSKKEWSIGHWAKLLELCKKDNYTVIISAGPSDREQDLIKKLKEISPEITVLAKTKTLDIFIATIAHARCVVSPDTSTIHFSAGLGIPTISLFGPTASSKWAPIGSNSHPIQGTFCPCSGHLSKCIQKSPCINSISPEVVFEKIKEVLA